MISPSGPSASRVRFTSSVFFFLPSRPSAGRVGSQVSAVCSRTRIIEARVCRVLPNSDNLDIFRIAGIASVAVDQTPVGQAGSLQTSSPRANHFDDLVSGWQSASLFLRINSLAIHENVEYAWPAQANPSGNLQFAFDAVFQTHGPSVDVTSKETALEFHSHIRLPQILPRILVKSVIDVIRVFRHRLSREARGAILALGLWTVHG